jgi:acyl CoA:acetate/3-ketoacid CoA transferase
MSTAVPSVAVVSASDAVSDIPSGATVLVEGSGGGLLEPDQLISALAERFANHAAPRDLELVFVSSIGDNIGGGLDVLAQPGLIGRAIGGMWGKNPALARMAQAGEFPAFAPPQGVLAQLCRDVAAQRPGLITRAGLGTYCDPRHQGARINDLDASPIVELLELDGEEWLRYFPFSPDFAFIRGTYADERGNISFESEPARLEALAVAQACRNSGGVVIAQVSRVVAATSLDPRLVTVPGILVDRVVESPHQRQLTEVAHDGALSGEVRARGASAGAGPRGPRRVIASRALAEIAPGNVVNLGVGVADGIASLAAERGVLGTFTLTVEQGVIGGIPSRGLSFGTSVNPEAIIDEPAQFDFYDGGGIDIAFLGFAQIDATGNVNVSKFNGRLFGPGGFINITSGTRRLVFCGTFTAGGLDVEIARGRLSVRREGNFAKFVEQLEQITFDAQRNLHRGASITIVTERAVFDVEPGQLRLREIAPGTDLERDVLQHIPFTVASDEVVLMDARHFSEDPHG